MTLPTGWAFARIDELVGVNGLVSDGDWVESKDQDQNGRVRLTQLADVGEGNFRDKSARFMTTKSAESLGCTYLQAGDVLVARMPDPIGRACVFPGLDRPAVTAVDVMIVRSDGVAANPAWLVKWINSPSVRRAMADGAGGTTRQRIAGGRIKEMQLPLPPLAEQRRIVAKLDTLTARLTRARTELDRVTAMAESIRVSALRAIFFIDTDVPEGWKVERIDEIGTVQLGRQRSPKDHDGPQMRPYLRSANVTWTGFDLADVKQMNFSPAEFEVFALKTGDVLLNEGSGSAKEVGKPVVWDGAIEGACFQNTLLRIRPHSYDPRLLRYCLLYLAKSGAFIGDTQGVNIIHIGKTGLSRIKVPVPPVDQQSHLLEKIDHAFARADRLEAEAARARALLDRLEAALLARAFRGELVAQDPADEPASVLLDRIRTERAATPTAKRGRRSTPASAMAV